MKKRLLGILLSFALMLTMMPVLGLNQTAYAALNYDWSTDKTVEANTTYDEQSVTVSNNITITIPENVTVTITKGIFAGSHTLTVEGAGTLNVNGINGTDGGASEAGTNGGNGFTGILIVDGVTVNVTGGVGGKGGNGDISGKSGGSGGSGVEGDVTIKKGSIEATGGNGGKGGDGDEDGGGGGKGGDGITGVVTVTGGSATVTGGTGGKGGGGSELGGFGGIGGDGITGAVTVTGGSATVTGGTGGKGGDAFGDDGEEGEAVSGTITGTTIRVSDDGEKWDTITSPASDCEKQYAVVESPIAVKSVSLNKTSTTLIVGDSETLTATVEPEDATHPDLDWESSDVSVATVDGSGEVTAVAKGTATITVKSLYYPDKTTTCTVTVKEKSTPTPTPTPAANPLTITTTAKTSARSMTVKWTWNNVPGAKSYKVSYHKVGSKKWTTKKTKKTKYVFKGHKMKGLYEYKVAAVTASGDVWSNTSCRYFKGVKTKAKAGKAAGTVRASWKKDKGATGYQVKLATNKKLNGAQVVNVSADKKSYTFSGLKSGKKYYVSVRPLKDHNGVTYQGIRCKALKVKTK